MKTLNTILGLRESFALPAGKHLLMFAILLTTSLSFAWTAGYEPPSCLTRYTLLGMNFTIEPTSTMTNCGADTAILQGKLTADSGVIFANSNSLYNSTHLRLQNSILTGSGNLSLNYVGLPDSGNWTFHYAVGSTNPSISIRCQYANGTMLPMFSKIGPAAPGWAVLTTNDSINYQINSTGRTCNKNTDHLVLDTFTDGTYTVTLDFPLYNSSRTGAPSLGSWANYAPPSKHYVSINELGHGALRSDLSTTGIGKIFSEANASAYCRIPLYFTSSGGTSLIHTNITYFPGTSAFANFANQSSQESFILNNTATYILDTDAERWYYLAATTCTPGQSYAGGAAVSYFASASGETPINWGTYNGSTASLAGGSTFCNGTGGKTAVKVRVRTAGTTSQTYNITLLNSTGSTLRWINTTGIDSITEIDMTGYETTTNITVSLLGQPAFVNMPVRDGCSPALTMPNTSNKGNTALTAIMIVILAVAMETWLAMGFWTFCIGMLLLGTALSTGLFNVGLLCGIAIVVEIFKQMGWQ